MPDTRAARIVRVDAAVAGHRDLYLKAIFAGHDGEAEAHEWQVDRLLDLRNRIQQHPPRRPTMPSHKVYRDAVTGEWVTEEYAAQHPDTTVAETIEDDAIGEEPAEDGEASQ